MNTISVTPQAQRGIRRRAKELGWTLLAFIITGLMLFIGVFVLIVNLLVDLSYGYLDPKIRYQ